MTPIEPILGDIRDKLGTADVRLPRYGELFSIVAISQALHAVEFEGMTPQPNNSDAQNRDAEEMQGDELVRCLTDERIPHLEGYNEVMTSENHSFLSM